MPFFGGWIGYTYAPEKVIEVEKVFDIQKPSNDIILPGNTDDLSEVLEDDYIYLDYTYFDYEISFGDTSNWVQYESKEYGFALNHPAHVRVSVSDDDEAITFQLDGLDVTESYVTPTVTVYKNTQNIGIVDLLNMSVDDYTTNVYVTNVDGRPAIKTVSRENGLSVTTVVTQKYIFHIIGPVNIVFDHSVVGPSELNINWPEKVKITNI